MKATFTTAETVIDLFEIIKTIEEALLLILSNNNHSFLLRDIGEGLNTVSQSIQAITIENTSVQKNTAEQLEQLILTVKNNNLHIKTFFGQVKNFTLNYQLFSIYAIFEALAQTETCPAELARKIFTFCDDCPEQLVSNKSILMWSCALKSGESLPKEAYERTMQAFSINPDLHKSIHGDHLVKYQPHQTIYHENCPMCCGKGTPYFMAPQYLAINYETSFQPAKLWMKCRCGTLFAYNFPKLSQEEFTGCDSTTDDEQILPRYPLSIFENILNNILKYSKGNTLLEVGIGNGELALTAQEMGFEVEAVEISIKEARKAKEQLGLNVHCCDFMKFQSDKKYDVITMGDVLEHVDSPLVALKKAEKLLNPHGILWISTPNYNSGFSKYYKFKDPMWKEPWHFTYFSRETLIPYLKEMSFEILQYNVSTRYNGSMELILEKNCD